MLEHIRFWAESCPCHGPSLNEIVANPRLAEGPAHRKRRNLEKLLGSPLGMFKECPVASKRAPFLATESLIERVCADLVAKRQDVFGLHLNHHLSAEERSLIMCDFQSAS